VKKEPLNSVADAPSLGQPVITSASSKPEHGVQAFRAKGEDFISDLSESSSKSTARRPQILQAPMALASVSLILHGRVDGLLSGLL
jgi:hypothetical protein